MKKIFILAALALIVACKGDIKPGEEGDMAIKVTGVSIDRSSLNIKEGESVTLVATVTPADATNKNVTWSSSSNEIATVDNSGKVTGVRAGDTTITVTTEDGNRTASCPVTVESNLAPSVTVGADHISAVSAVLMGKANLGSTVSSDLMVGFQYSKSAGILPSNSTTVEAVDADADYNYSTGITGLEPATKYYFRSFVRQNGQDTYGETKEFKTSELSSMIHTQSATAVSAISAKLNANLDMTNVLFTTKSIGFYWGTSAESMSSKVAITDDTGLISVDLSALTPSTQYFYQAYIVLDGEEHKEAISSFTTKEITSLLETKDASEVETTSAKLNAKLNLTDIKYNDISYGFYWSTSETSQSSIVKGGEITDNSFSSAITNLAYKTQYMYMAYVKLDDQTFFGEKKTFITYFVPEESVSLDKSEYVFTTIGDQLSLEATVLPPEATDKTVRWATDDQEVATVTQNGKVTAKGNGKATITATTKDQGKTASCAITVAQWVTSISLDSTSLTLNEGQEKTLNTTVIPENSADKSLQWTSSDKTVAIVDENGKVTAISKGTATIMATANDGSGKYACCSVTVKRLVSSIQLNKTSLTTHRGNDDVTEMLLANVIPSDANNTSVSWTSSNTTVATISSSGVLTGKARGYTTITASANDGSGVNATCEVEVKQYVTSIKLNEESLMLNDGGVAYLYVNSILPENANDKSYSWTSSDVSIATVDANGKVTAVSKGTATIMASANDGSGTRASCSITQTGVQSGIILYEDEQTYNTLGQGGHIKFRFAPGFQVVTPYYDIQCTSNVDWLRPSGVGGQYGEWFSYSFNVDENNSGTDREGTLTFYIDGQTSYLKVTQTYTAPEIVFNDPTSTLGYQAGSTWIDCTIRWPRFYQEFTYETDVDWLTIEGGTYGITVQYAENKTNIIRSATITAHYMEFSKSITVTQGIREYFDLVLTDMDNSSVQYHINWASCNVGAPNGNLCGNYYTWSQAQSNLPSGSRLPTLDEWNDFQHAFNWTETSIGGINGFVGTPIGEANAWIDLYFIPESGRYNNTSTTSLSYNNYAYYWSSTPYQNTTSAYWGAYFYYYNDQYGVIASRGEMTATFRVPIRVVK